MNERDSFLPGSTERTARSSVRAHPLLLDALMGAGVALALSLIIATSSSHTRPPDVVSYLFVVGFGALLLLRRHMPRIMLVFSVLGMFTYYTLDYPPIGIAIPVAAALFSTAELGLMVWSVGAASTVFVVSLFFRVLDGEEPLGFVLGYESVSNIALFAAAIALGYSLRTKRIRAAQQSEIVRLTEAQVAREAELRIQTERERISRELHDTVGHTMSVISLQAGVASEAIGHDDPAASEALDRIRAASSRTLRDLRSMVRILCSASDEDETRRVHSLSAIEEIIETAQGIGFDVTTEITVDPSDLSAPVDSAAYRIIQESITNIIKHSGASRAYVAAKICEGHLRLNISDNGRGSTDDGSRCGYGLAGMSDRVRLLGGFLTVDSTSSGFTVNATIPARLP